jgi:hypothetical protein
MPKDKARKKEKKEKKQRQAEVYDSFSPDEPTAEELVEHEGGSQNGSVVVTVEEQEPDLPAIFTPQLEGDYSAAFESELLSPVFLQKAFLAQLAPGVLLPHSGRVRLTSEGLEFEGLTTIPFSEMIAVEVHTDRVYHRYYAGLAALGGRGSQSRTLTGGEPFMITFREQGQARTLYALLDWAFFLALTKEKGWRKAVGGVLPAKEKKKG